METPEDDEGVPDRLEFVVAPHEGEIAGRQVRVQRWEAVPAGKTRSMVDPLGRMQQQEFGQQFAAGPGLGEERKIDLQGRTDPVEAETRTIDRPGGDPDRDHIQVQGIAGRRPPAVTDPGEPLAGRRPDQVEGRQHQHGRTLGRLQSGNGGSADPGHERSGLDELLTDPVAHAPIGRGMRDDKAGLPVTFVQADPPPVVRTDTGRQRGHPLDLPVTDLGDQILIGEQDPVFLARFVDQYRQRGVVPVRSEGNLHDRVVAHGVVTGRRGRQRTEGGSDAFSSPPGRFRVLVRGMSGDGDDAQPAGGPGQDLLGEVGRLGHRPVIEPETHDDDVTLQSDLRRGRGAAPDRPVDQDVVVTGVTQALRQAGIGRRNGLGDRPRTPPERQLDHVDDSRSTRNRVSVNQRKPRPVRVGIP